MTDVTSGPISSSWADWREVKVTSGPISSLWNDITGLQFLCVDYLEVFLMIWAIVGYLGLWSSVWWWLAQIISVSEGWAVRSDIFKGFILILLHLKSTTHIAWLIYTDLDLILLRSLTWHVTQNEVSLSLSSPMRVLVIFPSHCPHFPLR